MIVIALDPGKTTGIVMWSYGYIHASGEMSRQEALAYVEAWGKQPDLHVVIERFFISQTTVGKEGDAHWALGAIGVIEYLAERDGFTFTIQGASAAKNFSSDERLKSLGWYRSTKGGHCNDAIRHLLLYLVKNQLIDPRTLLMD